MSNPNQILHIQLLGRQHWILVQEFWKDMDIQTHDDDPSPKTWCNNTTKPDSNQQNKKCIQTFDIFVERAAAARHQSAAEVILSSATLFAHLIWQKHQSTTQQQTKIHDKMEKSRDNDWRKQNTKKFKVKHVSQKQIHNISGFKTVSESSVKAWTWSIVKPVDGHTSARGSRES